MAEVAVTPGVAALFEAVSRRAPITFSYRGGTRRLQPYGVVLRWGHWYVVGHDVERDAPPRVPDRPHRRRTHGGEGRGRSNRRPGSTPPSSCVTTR